MEQRIFFSCTIQLIGLSRCEQRRKCGEVNWNYPTCLPLLPVMDSISKPLRLFLSWGMYLIPLAVMDR
uniref:Uncharacterized protein n=1 Tax=Brassica oleracea TaxID=3712 RepID=A0A3P6EXH4_BRAOL|nr:unnamed protein product [Brassica oleracea]